ncbi:MAG: transcription factor S [Nanoarchaeota archaeon]
MMFCEKCGKLLVPKKDGKKVDISCKCGFIPKKKPDLLLKEQVKLDKKDEIEIIDKRVEILPKTNEECPKCKHKEAYYWLVQTRAADEAATRFFKCVKCMHTWRAY